MKIAFVSQLDPGNIQEWSGTPYFMVDGLRERGHSVTVVGPLKLPVPNVLKMVERSCLALSGKHCDLNRYPVIARQLSKQAATALGNEHFDAILCPSSIVCAYLDSSLPIITWEDATFAGMVGYYPGQWMNFSQAALEHGNLLQQLSLKKAALSIFCSDWAAETAIENYQVDQSRIKVLPFGANLLEIPTPEEISTAIEQRSQASGCRLLFMGVDWERKGGDLVLATAEILHRSGTKVSVDIVGCQPPGAVPDYVHTHGFISKSTAVGRAKIKSLLLAAHYLFVPSIAECYGLVFAEASAFGVPSLARATGGIPSAVSNGINGWAFDIDASPTAYAGYITGQLASQGTYRASALRARQFYEERLNWRVAIDTLESLLTGLAKH